MPKMSTIKKIAVGEVKLDTDEGDVGRIERNLFALDGGTFEALRFCKNRNGRHNRVHLVIREDTFAELFEDAVGKGVFAEKTLNRLQQILERRQLLQPERAEDSEENPFLKVIGIFEDGHLAEKIDEDLYGDEPS